MSDTSAVRTTTSWGAPLPQGSTSLPDGTGWEWGSSRSPAGGHPYGEMAPRALRCYSENPWPSLGNRCTRRQEHTGPHAVILADGNISREWDIPAGMGETGTPETPYHVGQVIMPADPNRDPNATLEALRAVDQAHPGTVFLMDGRDPNQGPVHFRLAQPGDSLIDASYVYLSQIFDWGSGSVRTAQWPAGRYSHRPITIHRLGPGTEVHDAPQAPSSGEPKGTDHLDKDAVARALRDAALTGNWCSEWHQYATELGVPILGAKRTVKVTLEIEVEVTKHDYMGSGYGGSFRTSSVRDALMPLFSHDGDSANVVGVRTVSSVVGDPVAHNVAKS